VYYPGLPSDPFHELQSKCVVLNGFFQFRSGKRRLIFLKNKTLTFCRIFRWSRVTGKLFGNDGTRIDSEDKRKKLESPMI
jgi:hypothetical protein